MIRIEIVEKLEKEDLWEILNFIDKQ
ncbi:MAG: hypothetical protein EZS28_052839, partial [Streblomastix strix]